MIKQIDRVIGDLVRQVEEFRKTGGQPICIGFVGVNSAAGYTSYEGEREWPTDGKKHKHPVQEAAEAERHRLSMNSKSCPFVRRTQCPFRLNGSITNRRQKSTRRCLFEFRGSTIDVSLSTPFHKYDHVCCVAFRFWLGATREHPPSRPVGMTEEQQRQNRKATQPCGRRFFSAQTSLLAPYPDVSGKGMRVARASSGPKIPRRKRGRIYEMGY